MAKTNIDQLSKQILLKGFVPVILIVFSIVAFQYYFYANKELKNNQQDLKVIAHNLSTTIEGGNQFAVGLAQTMAQAQTNGLFGNRLGSSQYAKDVLTSHPALTGVYFGYEPNADQSDQLFLSKHKNHPIAKGLDASGRFLPYWFRDTQQQNAISLTASLAMETSQYYQGAKDLFNQDKTSQYLVTEPYEYEGKLIVEHVFPIVIADQFKGVAVVDRALNDLVKLLKTESENFAVEVFLISSQGRFISSTIKQNQQLLTLPIDTTPYAELFASPVSKRNANWFVMAQDPFENSDYFYTSAKVETGNWMVIVRKPKELVTGVIWQTAALLLGISILGLISSGWLIYRVLKKTNKRINLALQAANELARGEIPNAKRIYKSTNQDEVSILLSSFKDVVDHYENIRLACKRMAEGDFSRHLTEKSPKDVLSQSLNTLSEKLSLTEKNMLEAKHLAESANRSKSQFLANMSHEIRTPMNAIIGLSRLCLNTELTHKQKDYLVKIQSSGQSLLNLINDILDFSKIESGKMELEKTPFSLEKLFEDLSSVTLASAQQKGLELLFNVPFGPEIFFGDPLRIGQVLTNLTNNAVKFSESGDIVVEVKITPKDSGFSLLSFEVTDQGIGISPQQQTKLFSAFSQAESSTTREFGGTGLGLVICKNLVELMGGQIQINSELGVGTKVSFSIELEHFKNPQLAPVREIPKALQNLRILLVDDNEIARDIIQLQFERLSLTCDVAASGQEAINQLEKHAQVDPYQLVLMDWKMPEMDGLETVKRIQQNPKLPKATTILMITSFYGEQSTQLFNQHGIEHYLKKPMTDSDLLQMVINCFDTNKAIDSTVDKKWQLESQPKLQGVNILVAEDNLINQQIIREYLHQAGIKFDVVKNGKQAVEHVQKYQYNAVLMDLQMPIMGGIEATEIIRTLPEGHDLPIIAMTANAMPQHKQACMAAGMNAHLSKPIDVDELFNTLEQYIQQPLVINRPENSNDQASDISINPAQLSYIDFDMAISRSDNDKSNALKLMAIFKDTHQSELATFEQAISSNSHHQTTQYAHNIAGVAEFVGAKQLADLARTYENYHGEIGSEPHLTSLKSLYKELKGVLNEILVLLDNPSPSKDDISTHTEDDAGSAALDDGISSEGVTGEGAPNEGVPNEGVPSEGAPNLTLPKFIPSMPAFDELEQLPNVLIVDDDPICITILQGLLKDKYQLHSAENGKVGIDKIAETMPDLILLDINMPVMDGFTTCEILKQLPKYADIPIIFITSENSDVEAKCLTLGAVDFIPKPFVKEIVQARVATHLALHQKNTLLQAKGATDQLTQVANLGAYKEKIIDELARAKRETVPLSLLKIDLDQFSLYTDNYGQLMSDKCLQKVASFLSLQLKRPGDFIARLGNKEFVVILPNTPLEGAHEIATRLKNCVESLNYEHILSTHKIMTVSIGTITANIVGIINLAGLTSDELMTQVDIQLFKAQKAGGNQVQSDVYV